jgi:membrane protein YqaA with SNARE-associated domain
VSEFFHSVTKALISCGPWGLLLLAFLDSAGIPVAAGMDAVVILVAANAPQRAYLGAALAVLGSVAGNLVLFTASRAGRRWTRKEEEALAPGEPGRFELWFRRFGLVTIFVPAVVPVVPLPLKVFVISAGVMRAPLPSFLAVIVAARVARYFGEAYLGIQLGQASMGWLKAHVWSMAWIALALCLSVSAILLWRERRR